VNQHQLSVNGKFRDITTHDLPTVADRFSIPGRKSLLDAVNTAVGDWPRYAADAGVSENTRQDIARLHCRL
jgi:serine/threonine-protein kinase HipA